MTRSIAFALLLFCLFTGCSKSDSKPVEGTSNADAHASPKAAVKAVIAEARKDNPDKDVIFSLMSDSFREYAKNEKDYQKFLKRIRAPESITIEGVTMSKSGKHAKVHIVLKTNAGTEKLVAPTILVDGKWYAHEHYGENDEVKAVPKSASGRDAKTDR